MKTAEIWKRILHQGIHLNGLPADAAAFQREVIRSPIIVDSRPLTPVIEGQLIGKRDTKSLTRLAFPFPYFWIEGLQLIGWRFGASVRVEKGKDGFSIGAVCVISIDGMQPEMLGVVFLNCDLAGNTTSTELPRVAPAIAEINGEEKLAGILLECEFAIADSLQLLGCNNVSLAGRDSDPKQVRLAVKRHGPSSTGYRYHVLTVRPAGSKPSTPGIEFGNMPRHVCRGYFSEYGPDYGKGLLFGKYAGRFFVPPHIKGKAENGIVEKDYRVVAS